jgi:nitroreductase
MPIRDPALETWASAIDEFPLGGSRRDQLAALVPFAILAPSSHNSQPWLFKLTGDALELRADRRRRLPVVDPEDRELVISCGAALGYLEAALHNFGYQGAVEVLPDEKEPELLARIGLGGDREVTERDRAMFAAIRKRRTHRLPFSPRPLESDLLTELERIAAENDGWLRIIQLESSRLTLADLICEGDREQMEDPAFREELASWMHPSRTRSQDGMPGWALGLGQVASVVAPMVIRTFDTGNEQAARHRDLALGSPVLAILGTDTDTRRDWLQTGRTLVHILLRAQVDGVAASYLNQPIEVGHLRHKVQALLGHSGFAHLILRMGYPIEDNRKTPRRQVEEVLVEEPATAVTSCGIPR